MKYEFMRRFIHFCDNTAKRRLPLDPIVSYVMGEIMKYMHKAWTAGRDITIDESMIKYKGSRSGMLGAIHAKEVS